MSGMRPYSGPDVRCVKCGWVGADTTWVAGVEVRVGCGLPQPGVDVLERTCARCGYLWDEKTLDVAPLGHPWS